MDNLFSLIKESSKPAIPRKRFKVSEAAKEITTKQKPASASVALLKHRSMQTMKIFPTIIRGKAVDANTIVTHAVKAFERKHQNDVTTSVPFKTLVSA